MKWAALAGFWGTWIALTLVCSVLVFVVTVFTGDSPQNKAVAERLMTAAFVLTVLAFLAGGGALLYWPGWQGWLIACGATLLVPVIVFFLMANWMP